MVPWILHVDVDAFFASVEQALNPGLRGRPVIVGGDGCQRTVVASCSYEARRFGVRSAMRTAEARRLCPQALFLPGDQRVYQRAADALFGRLGRLSRKVQPVSLDEAYVELPEGLNGRHPLLLAEELCREVWRSLRLPLSVGIATSKLLARLATRLAKPRGCFFLRPAYERDFLEGLPIEELPGVGPRTAELLHGFNIQRVRDLRNISRELLRETLGSRGEQLHAFAHGHDERTVEPVSAPRSVSRETSLERPARTLGVLFALASYLLDRAMKEVLAQGLAARTLKVRLRYVDGHFMQRTRTLPTPMRHEANLVPLVKKLLEQLFTRRVAVHLVGVTLAGLVHVDSWQRSLFAGDEQDRQERLGAAVRLVRERHGFGAILQGAEMDLLHILPRDRDGFRLRIPSLTR